MAFTNKTPNLGLPQWLPDDKPTWLTDMNGAFSDIDGAVMKDRGDFASLQSTVTNQGITISSNTEAIHNNATSIVAANNNIESIRGDISSLVQIINIPKPSIENIAFNSWSCVIYRINSLVLCQFASAFDVHTNETKEIVLYTGNFPVVTASYIIGNTSGVQLDLRYVGEIDVYNNNIIMRIWGGNTNTYGSSFSTVITHVA